MAVPREKMPVPKKHSGGESSSAELLPFRQLEDSGIEVKELSEIPPELQELMKKAEAAKPTEPVQQAEAVPASSVRLELAKNERPPKVTVDFVSNDEPGDPGPLSPAQAEQKLQELTDSIGGSPLTFETGKGPVAGGRDLDAFVNPHAIDRLKKGRSRQDQAIDAHQAEIAVEKAGESEDLSVIRTWMEKVSNIDPAEEGAAGKLEEALERYKSMLADHSLWMKQAEEQLQSAGDDAAALLDQVKKERTVQDHLTVAIAQANEKLSQIVDKNAPQGSGLFGRLLRKLGGGR